MRLDPEILAAAGIDLDNAMMMLEGDDKFYANMLELFYNNNAYGDIKKHLKDAAYPLAAKSAHALKGVAANLSMDPLYHACVALELAVRKASDDADIERCAKALDDAYQPIIDALEQLR